jgi:membrane protein CcdC involved in cytochrome C biogenesis
MKIRGYKQKGYLPFIVISMAIFYLLDQSRFGQVVARDAAMTCFFLFAMGMVFLFSVLIYVKLKTRNAPPRPKRYGDT